MFNTNCHCFFKKKSNKITPIKSILSTKPTWEIKKTVEFDNLNIKSPKYKENIMNVYNES